MNPYMAQLLILQGKGLANPIATVLSFAMALRYSLDLDNEADALEKSVQAVLNDGLRTKDILSEDMKEVSTSEMGDAIISNCLLYTSPSPRDA